MIRGEPQAPGTADDGGSARDKSLLLACMGDTPQLRLIDLFLDNRGNDYTKREIMEHAGIAKTELCGIWDDMAVRFGLLKPTGKCGGERLFALDRDNELAKRLADLDSELVRRAMPAADPLPAK